MINPPPLKDPEESDSDLPNTANKSTPPDFTNWLCGRTFIRSLTRLSIVDYDQQTLIPRRINQAKQLTVRTAIAGAFVGAIVSGASAAALSVAVGLGLYCALHGAQKITSQSYTKFFTPSYAKHLHALSKHITSYYPPGLRSTLYEALQTPPTKTAKNDIGWNFCKIFSKNLQQIDPQHKSYQHDLALKIEQLALATPSPSAWQRLVEKKLQTIYQERRGPFAVPNEHGGSELTDSVYGILYSVQSKLSEKHPDFLAQTEAHWIKEVIEETLANAAPAPQPYKKAPRL